MYVDVSHTRYFSVEGIPLEMFSSNDFVIESNRSHLEKLEELTQHVYARADEDDWIMFLDSDAFPLRRIAGILNGDTELIGVQRLENGDFHPHPCFTLTRVGQWKQLGENNWQEGTWMTAKGVPATEMGGTLLKRITEQGTDWMALNRLNDRGLHRLWFGIYGSPALGPVVYHHGAGSRPRVSRSDKLSWRQVPMDRAKRAAWAMQRKRSTLLASNVWSLTQGDPSTLDEAVMTLIESDQDPCQVLLD